MYIENVETVKNVSNVHMLLHFQMRGFLTCTNTKCGIIYKDTTDQTAEWRYYGADDNQSGDPTRCGMPINPLLRDHFWM